MARTPVSGTDIQFVDRAVYLAAADALVLSDLHVGRQAAASVDAPLGEATDLTDRFAALLSTFEPATVVIAGDLLHSFSRPHESSRKTVLELFECCKEARADPVAIVGNHDSRLAECWPEGVEAETALSDGTVVCHGHEEPTLDGPRYLIGHDHPAIAIEGVRRPCYLYGEGAFRGGDLLVLPAFTRLAGGVEINRHRGSDFQSPLVSSLGSFRPIVWDADADEALWFPPLASFRRLL